MWEADEQNKYKIIGKNCENDKGEWIKRRRICLYRHKSIFCGHNSLFLFANANIIYSTKGQHPITIPKEGML